MVKICSITFTNQISFRFFFIYYIIYNPAHMGITLSIQLSFRRCLSACHISCECNFSLTNIPLLIKLSTVDVYDLVMCM